MSTEREISKHSVLLCPDSGLNSVGKYIMTFESTTEAGSIDQSPEEQLQSASIPVPRLQRAGSRASTSAARSHSGAPALPRPCKKPKQEISNNNYTAASRRAPPHFDGDKWDMACCTAHNSSCQQSLWRLKTLRFKFSPRTCALVLSSRWTASEPSKSWEATPNLA